MDPFPQGNAKAHSTTEFLRGINGSQAREPHQGFGRFSLKAALNVSRQELLRFVGPAYDPARRAKTLKRA